MRVPAGARVRPTAERVREALFSILGHDLAGLVVLDAYAGSGALGFEALSRGARRATFLESDRRVAGVIRRNAQDLGVAERAVVLCGRAEDLLPRGEAGGPFDLVFADPPYVSEGREVFLRALASWVTPGGRVVLERDVRSEPAVGGRAFGLVRTARYGRVCLDFYAPRAA